MELNIRSLSKSFEEKDVLKDLNLCAKQGKIYALLGRNGCGKTTLFNCISGEIKFEEGSITVDEVPLKGSDVGFVYTTPMLPEFLTGYEFLAFFIDIHKEYGFDRKDLNSYFDSIQINVEDRHRLIKEYSHGMRNKLQMLIILMLKPKIILLDEPLTSLDLVASVQMKQKLLEIKEDSIMILSTHILQIARDVCDEVFIMQDGKVELLAEDALNNPDFEQEIMEKLTEHEH